MSGDHSSRWTEQRTALTKYVQSKLLVRHLQIILKKLALPVSGLKVAQQARLIEQIDKVVLNRNEEGLQQLKRLIYNPDTSDTQGSPIPSTVGPPLATPLPHKGPNFTNPIGSASIFAPLSHSGYSPGTSSSASPPFSQLQLYYPEPMAKRKSAHPPAPSSPPFHSSPFYEVITGLTGPHTLAGITSTTATQRAVVNVHLSLNPHYADDVRRGLRTILYCGEGPYNGLHHVAFPQQIEIRVNGKPVSANLRGLKNKPGTTRPLDITDHIDKTAGFKNIIAITYAMSQKRYFAVVKLVKKSTPEDLVAQIKKRPHISKQNVLDRLRKESQDPDIVATSSIMSLKCPASTLRIVTPIRSTACKHHQCYDAISFLQLQEQAPTWMCPVCSKKIEFEHLAVDKYVEEILNSVPQDTEAVTIDPMGQWKVPEQKEPSPRIKRDRDSDDEEDEDSENEISILDSAPSSFRGSMNGFHTPVSVNHGTPSAARPIHLSTPKSLSSEPLLNPSTRPNGGSSHKRAAAITIDLTLSDDDDVRPPPPKRHQTSATPTPSVSYQKPPESTGPFTLSWSNSYPGFDN